MPGHQEGTMEAVLGSLFPDETLVWPVIFLSSPPPLCFLAFAGPLCFVPPHVSFPASLSLPFTFPSFPLSSPFSHPCGLRSLFPQLHPASSHFPSPLPTLILVAGLSKASFSQQRSFPTHNIAPVRTGMDST